MRRARVGRRTHAPPGRGAARRCLALGLLVALVLGWGPVASATVPAAPHDLARATGTDAVAPAPSGTGLVPLTYAPHASLRSFPLATPVNPYVAYTSEPAPMGIADFGIGPNGVPYRYTTPEFEGTLEIVTDHGYTYYSSSGHTIRTNDVTFQLNVVLQFHEGGREMQFWVQDALFLNSTAHYAVFGNNVWNFSSGSGGLIQSNSLVGNGSDYGGVYEDLAQNGYLGSNVTLPYPVNLTTQVIASSIAGVPHVGLAYDDGDGFVTYDNVSFPWAKGWTVDGFVVDGTQYNPIGLFDDAEWDYDGPGNGLSSDNIASNLTLGLEYWNGHNLQSVPNAYDFGSDTAETTYNVAATLAAASAGPTPYAHLGNGSGSLGVLYDQSTMSIVNVSSPIPSGTLLVDGQAVPFVGGQLNLTLAPGNHSLQLTNATGPIGTVAVALTAGEYLRVAFHPRPLPQVLTVTETGLPSGTMFDVVVNGTFNASATGTVAFSLLNGTYPYSVTPIAGWELQGAYRGTLNVSGPTTLALVWQLATFSVTSAAQNLPDGVPWTLTVDGVAHAGGSGAAAFVLPNGTYDYSVSVGIVYLAQPANGSFTVQGAATVVTVPFGLDPGTLTGSVDPANATVTVGGTTVDVVGGLFSVTLVPGVYPVVVSAPGWNTTSRNVTLTPGNTTLESFELGLASSHPSRPGSNNGTSAGGGLSGTDVLAIVGAVGALAAVGVGLVAWRARPATRRPRPPRREPPAAAARARPPPGT